jgi:hypothetical protein
VALLLKGPSFKDPVNNPHGTTAWTHAAARFSGQKIRRNKNSNTCQNPVWSGQAGMALHQHNVPTCTRFSLSYRPVHSGGQGIAPQFFSVLDRSNDMSDKSKWFQRNEFRELVFSVVLLGLLLISLI